MKPEECDELNGQLVVTSFDKTSMSNIDAETKRSKKTQINYLWVHLCALWMVTLMMMKVLLVNSTHERILFTLLFDLLRSNRA